ncbi:MAG: TonB-dependent receptor, partial [Myxococcaceae bacterium]
AYDHELADGLKLSTRLNYKLQQPWHNRNPELDPVSNYNFYDKVAQRSTARVGLTWDVTDAVHLMVGGEFNYDHGNAEWMPEERYFGYTDPTVEYLSAAALAEAMVETDWVNITAGARFEAHSQFGSAFVPRIGLTKVLNPFHFKLMLSRAYRAPMIENMALSPDVKPELIDVGELEVGYQLNRSMLLTASIFDITLHQPIVYVWDPVTLTESYQNQESTGTRGAEIEYRYQGEFGYAIVGYSFYTAAGKPRIDWNRVPHRGDMTLAFPKHKLTLMGSANITRDFSINPSVVFMSKRFGNVTSDDAGVPVVGEYPAVTLVNVFLQYRNAFTPGLDIGLGVNNLLNADAAIIQAYRGTKAPYPGLSREAQVRLSWSY